MARKVNVTIGLAGVGKTFIGTLKVRTELDNGKRCIYLTFNRKLQASSLKKLKDVTSDVYTFHMLCYRALKDVGRGAEFDALMRDQKSANGESYDRLIEMFVATFSHGDIQLPLAEVHSVVIDEFQNTPVNLIPVVSLLAEKLDADFWVFGDPIQAIAHWKSGDARHFENLEEIFGTQPIFNEPLRKNHRSALCPLHTINGFLMSNFPEWYSQVAYDLKGHEGRDGVPTEAHIVTNATKEAELVITRLKEIRSVGGASVAILSRNKQGLEAVQEVIKREGLEEWAKENCDLSTIHSYIGREADVVFVIGLELPLVKGYGNRKDEARILYVGLSRARERLVIMTRSARSDVVEVFGPGLNIIDHRELFEWERKMYPEVCAEPESSYLTKKKHDRSTIDSIAIRVEEKDAPWLPYVGDGNLSKWSRKTNYSVDGVDIYVRRNLRHRFYKFILSDTNGLKRSNYTDQDIIEFLKHAVFRFFNSEFPIGKARVVRLDMCKLFEKGDESIFRIRSDLASYPMVPVGNNGKVIDRAKARERHTLYYHIRAHYGFQAVMYDPSKKESRNKLSNEDLYKIEVRLRNGCLGAGGYSEELGTFGGLEEELRHEETLVSWYWKALRYAGYESPNARKYNPPMNERKFLPGDVYRDIDVE